MNAMQYLITVLFDLYLMVVLLRLWLQFVRADFYNPFSQFVVKATQPIVAPLRRVIPSIGRFDTSTLVLAFVVAATKWSLLMMMSSQIDLLNLALISTLSVAKELGMLLFWMLIIRAILSWVSQGFSPFEAVLAQMTEPFLAPIRRIIPPMGGLDLSLLILMIGLNFINKLIGDLIGPIWYMV
ncbi:YggT family protein [Paraferrimonas sp. SM1919]|uniref:YggT family protein n=1 Tax=Paraferrimonas sp. SM1919 TaxID=2662263 RepID=UPI0013D46F66|nr:YggT family protein [Paraferrimonas sp. SM1919]